jgi:hypothetical protein
MSIELGGPDGPEYIQLPDRELERFLQRSQRFVVNDNAGDRNRLDKTEKLLMNTPQDIMRQEERRLWRSQGRPPGVNQNMPIHLMPRFEVGGYADRGYESDPVDTGPAETNFSSADVSRGTGVGGGSFSDFGPSTSDGRTSNVDYGGGRDYGRSTDYSGRGSFADRVDADIPTRSPEPAESYGPPDPGPSPAEYGSDYGSGYDVMGGGLTGGSPEAYDGTRGSEGDNPIGSQETADTFGPKAMQDRVAEDPNADAYDFAPGTQPTQDIARTEMASHAAALAAAAAAQQQEPSQPSSVMADDRKGRTLSDVLHGVRDVVGGLFESPQAVTDRLARSAEDFKREIGASPPPTAAAVADPITGKTLGRAPTTFDDVMQPAEHEIGPYAFGRVGADRPKGLLPGTLTPPSEYADRWAMPGYSFEGLPSGLPGSRITSPSAWSRENPDRVNWGGQNVNQAPPSSTVDDYDVATNAPVAPPSGSRSRVAAQSAPPSPVGARPGPSVPMAPQSLPTTAPMPPRAPRNEWRAPPTVYGDEGVYPQPSSRFHEKVMAPIGALGLSHAIPGLGLASGVSGLFGGPTTRSVLAGSVPGINLSLGNRGDAKDLPYVPPRSFSEPAQPDAPVLSKNAPRKTSRKRDVMSMTPDEFGDLIVGAKRGGALNAMLYKAPQGRGPK